MSYTIKFLSQLAIEFVPGPSLKFKLVLPFKVQINGDVLELPIGTTTDFASVPQLFNNLIENDDPQIVEAAVLHDYLYQNLGKVWGPDAPAYSRSDCDDILLSGMIAASAPWLKRNTVWLGVRVGGWKAWNGYKNSNGKKSVKYF